jgi:hypothetical protein
MPEKPLKHHTKSLEKTDPRSTGSAVADDRRRIQRVMMRVKVVLRFTADGKEVSLPAHTVAVNLHGAMICAGQSIPAGMALEVEHKVTRERIAGKVTRQAQSSPDGFLIPFEFGAPSSNFWRISFPPSDWKPTEG